LAAEAKSGIAKLMVAMLIVVCASVVTVGSVYALDQPVEWADNPGSARYSLSSLGRSYGNCDWHDYGFRLVKNFSADPERYRLNATSSQVAAAFRGKSVIGYQLETPYDAYICTGFRDTWRAGGPGNVASHLFVWIQ
jgi:hypothetical protein